MAKYRNALPQLGDRLFLTDGGIETTLIFLEGQELPLFAAFDLLKTADGLGVLREYFRRYAELAARFRTGVVLETPTWRASADWARQLGYSSTELRDFNRRSVALIEDVREEFESAETPIVISGCVGPRGDGYVPGDAMSVVEAREYHAEQIGTFAETGADLVTAITMNYVEEAIGIARAARNAGMPAVISFTVETDGRLPTGQPVGDAVLQVDEESTVAYFMINCAHPSHFDHVITGSEPWARRIRGLRANASRMTHAELNEAPELDDGNPVELAADYARLVTGPLRDLSVLGGCCGTDHRHLEAIAAACTPLFNQRVAAI